MVCTQCRRGSALAWLMIVGCQYDVGPVPDWAACFQDTHRQHCSACHRDCVSVTVRTLPWASSGQSRDHLIDVPATPTLHDAKLRCNEALDWRRWTKGECNFPFVRAVLIELSCCLSPEVKALPREHRPPPRRKPRGPVGFSRAGSSLRCPGPSLFTVLPGSCPGPPGRAGSGP